MRCESGDARFFRNNHFSPIALRRGRKLPDCRKHAVALQIQWKFVDMTKTSA
jgi:hypothetical protein